MENIILFDMDGVLLKSRGYHRSLQESVSRTAVALGSPNTKLHEDQIAKFETLGVTNEWDSLAICTALILIQVWQIDPDVRFKSIAPSSELLISEPADFDWLLSHYQNKGDLPSRTVFQMIVAENDWLNTQQRSHLFDILEFCRDIYKSPTLPAHQESVLGSKLFSETYSLSPQLNVESNLLKCDAPIIDESFRRGFSTWLENDNHRAGILTNRPNRSPDGYLSAPEAEIGVNILGLNHLPVLGTGLISWFASTKLKSPEMSFIKPNPVHALALIQMCLGESFEDSLHFSTQLWSGRGQQRHWERLDHAKVVVFEDSIKGLISAKRAQDLLKGLGIDFDLKLIGIESHPIKTRVLMDIAHKIIKDINEVKWNGTHLLDEIFNQVW
jgi:hypothetical protein